MKATKLEDMEPVRQLIRKTVGKKYPDMLQNNLEAMPASGTGSGRYCRGIVM